MKTLALALAILFPSLASADSAMLAFKGGIGVDPVAGVTSTGTPAVNVVRGVSPGGFTWRITALTAEVQADGRISVDGRGLLLTAGNAIGTTGGQRVFAAVFCGPATTATAHSTSAAGVALAANGDFHIDDALTPAVLVSCDNPVLLILSAANGHWFAAGIPRNGSDTREE